MKEYSQEELRLLTEVLPNVARELRGAMGNVYIAANRLAPPDAREKDPMVDRNAAIFLQSYYRMYRVIGNLNDAALLAGTDRLPLKNGDVVSILREVCEKAEGLFEGEGVTLTFECNKPAHVMLLHEALLRRLLLNLLSNALKFTPRGGRVAVRLRVAHLHVHLSVSDTGSGVEPEKLEHIFEHFLETGAAYPSPCGMGLGLALCRRIAQGHGGTIVAESEVGKGTTITVSLPNDRSTSALLREPLVDSGGGFNMTLVELSDALGYEAFTHRFTD